MLPTSKHVNHEQTHRARAVLIRDPDGVSDGESENGEAANARDLFAWLSREVRELVSHVPRIHSPSPIGFLRDHVSSNRPAVITGAFDDWPAMERWNLDYLADAMGDAKVSVNVTPDGRGDALLSTDGWTVSGLGDDEMPGEVFVQPEEREMTLREFATMLATPTADLDANAHASRQSAVPYVSRQCGSLLEEFPSLVNDCADEVPFASEALGKPPDAVNLWIGDERSQTTFHRDHYENVYCVVRGVKVFHLLPPCDGRVLGYADAPAARFEQKLVAGENRFVLALERPRRTVAWASATPASLRARARTNPRDAVVPIVVVVKAGEALYLPAMWYHHVEQRRDESGQPAVAVNYWYDMSFDDRYAYARFAQEAHARFGGGNPSECDRL